jgi:hypothetical protein
MTEAGRGIVLVARSLLVVASIVATLWLVSMSWPTGIGSVQLVLLAAAALVLGVWVVAAVQVAASVRKGISGPGLALGLVPFVVTVAAGLTVLDVPLTARFAASRGAFDGVVSTAEQSRRPGEQRWYVDDVPEWLGTYRVDDVAATEDGVSFALERPGGGESYFSYRPDSSPAGVAMVPCRRAHDLGGDWYAVWTVCD